MARFRDRFPVHEPSAHAAGRAVIVLMTLEALSLALISSLHLSGVAGRNTKPPFTATGAGAAEAVICFVLVAATLAALRDFRRAWQVAVAAVSFAIVGFFVGLGFTLSGGDAADVAYHLTVLPFLLLTLALLLLRRRPPSPARRRVRGSDTPIL